MAAVPSPVRQLDYIGKELELFLMADTWKRYFTSRLRPYLVGDLLEVGAGMGANACYFYRDDLNRYVSLEPDTRLCDVYRGWQAEGRIPARCELVQGTLETLAPNATFDSIVYIDVLEHIEDDHAEFQLAYARLRPGGYLSVLCPAHHFLFSQFDRVIGHFRRYNKRMFLRLSDHKPLRIEYLDSIGMAASVANRLLLKQSYPKENQILFWDRCLVRMSRILDPLTFRRMGKSILGVWKK
jgi:SAM-dependent methyltransferase